MHISCVLVSQQTENVAFKLTENAVQAVRRELVVVHMHAMKAYKGRGDIAPISREEWSAPYHGHVIPQGKGPEVPKCW
jgi:hypothetical protein